MTLSDSIHLGDSFLHRPSWVDKDGKPGAAAERVEVIYAHPEGRYCIVQLINGLTDTIQTVPSERVAHPADLPENVGRHNHPVRNKYLRDRLRGLPVSQREISAAFGYGHSWLDYRLGSVDLTAKEQQEIIQVAERIAANKKSP